MQHQTLGCNRSESETYLMENLQYLNSQKFSLKYDVTERFSNGTYGRRPSTGGVENNYKLNCTT